MMRRKFALWICLSVSLSGCGSSESPIETVQNPTSESLPQSRFAPSEADEAKPALTSEEEMNVDVAKLIQRATQLEMRGQTAESLVVWEDVVQRISEEYGEAAWQVTSAKLSLEAARKRESFEVAQRVQALEIVELENQAKIELATGRVSAATNCLEKALELAQSVWGAKSHITFNVQYQLANCHEKMGAHAASLDLMRQVLGGRQELLGAVHPDTLEALELASALATRLEMRDESIAWGKEAIEVAEILEGGESLAVAKQRNNLGVSLVHFKDYEGGATQLKSALKIRRALLDPQSAEVAHTLYNLGQAQMSQGDWNSAASQFSSVCEILTGKDSEVASLAQARTQLGTVALLQEDLAGAETEFRTARALLENAPVLYEREFASACFKLGFVLGRQGKYKDAEPELRQALEIQQRILTGGDPELAQTQEIYTLVEGKLKAVRTGEAPGTVLR